MPMLYSSSSESLEQFKSHRRHDSLFNWRVLSQKGGPSRRNVGLLLVFVLFLLVYVPRSNPWSSLSTTPSTPFILTSLRSTPKSSGDEGSHIDLSNALSSVSRLTAPKFRPRCDPHDRASRYSAISRGESNFTIFLALDLRNSQWVLPTVIHELSVLLPFMGSHRFHVSIFENGSTDLTPSLLVTLASVLDVLGASYEIVVQGKHVKTSKEPNRRIIELARVRNAALDTLYTGKAAKDIGIDKFDVVLFVNDIIWCANDILEIIYEHVRQKSYLTCALDWESDVIYDRWVARTMSGLPFYAQESLIEYFNGPRAYKSPIPRPLPYDEHERQRLGALEPFQVFSCWNGAAVIDSKAFFSGSSDTMYQDYESNKLPENAQMPHAGDSLEIRFRTAQNDASIVTEKASECFLFSVDLWKKKLGRIMIVPRASVAYNLAQYQRVRQDGGRTVRHPIGIEPPRRSRIEASSPTHHVTSESGFSRQDGTIRSHESEDWNQIRWSPNPPDSVIYHDYAWWHEKERWGRWDEA